MQTTPTELDIRTSISRNAAVCLLANFFYLFSRLFIPPIILNHLSLHEYGIWTYCFIFVGYLGMSVFGVSNVYVRYIAVYAASQDTLKINRLVSTGILSVGTLCLLLVPVVWISLPTILHLFNVAPKLQPLAFSVIFGTTLIFLCDMTLSVFSSTLQSLQRFGIEKMFWILSILAEALIILVGLHWGLGLYALVAAYFVRVFLAIALYASACYRLIPGFSVRVSYFDKSLLKLFYHFGGIVQAAGILGTINRSIEKVVAGFFIGPSAAALYDVGEKFAIMATTLPSSINSVLLPATAHLHAKEMHSKILDVYLHGSRWVNLMTGVMMGFLGPFSTPIIIVWLGVDSKFSIASMILSFFTLAYQMDVVTGPASAIYRSINKPLRELVYPCLQFFLILMAASVMFTTWGVTIITINISVASMMVLSALLYIYLSNRYLCISQKKYFLSVILPGLIPYLFGLLLYFILDTWLAEVSWLRWPTFWRLLGALSLYLILLLPTIYWGLCGKEERKNIRQTFQQLMQERN